MPTAIEANGKGRPMCHDRRSCHDMTETPMCATVSAAGVIFDVHMTPHAHLVPPSPPHREPSPYFTLSFPAALLVIAAPAATAGGAAGRGGSCNRAPVGSRWSEGAWRLSVYGVWVEEGQHQEKHCSKPCKENARRQVLPDPARKPQVSEGGSTRRRNKASGTAIPGTGEGEGDGAVSAARAQPPGC